MKAILALLGLLAISSSTLAADLFKERVCAEKLTLTTADKPAAIQIAAVLSILDAGYQLKLTEPRKQKLSSYFEDLVKREPSKLIELGKNAYFVCITDLTSSDRSIGRGIIEKILAH